MNPGEKDHSEMSHLIRLVLVAGSQFWIIDDEYLFASVTGFLFYFLFGKPIKNRICSIFIHNYLLVFALCIYEQDNKKMLLDKRKSKYLISQAVNYFTACLNRSLLSEMQAMRVCVCVCVCLHAPSLCAPQHISSSVVCCGLFFSSPLFPGLYKES